MWRIILNLLIFQNCAIVLSISFSNASFFFSFFPPQFHRIPNRFHSLLIDAKNWIHKLGFHQLVSELRFLKSSVIYHLCFLSCCVFLSLFVLSILFNSILLFHLVLFYFIKSIFLFWTLSSINIFFIFFFIYYKKFVQKKYKKIHLSNLEPKFC